jgi:hypothetical protein
MANAFVKAQFMDPPGGPNSSAPLGAVKAGAGISISADGTISSTNSGGTISDIVATNGIQGGGQGPQVFVGLLPPTDSVIGGVRTVAGSGISIDSNGVIRSAISADIESGVGILAQDLGGGAYRISLLPAGSASTSLGGVFVPSASGLTLASTGSLTLSPPTGTAIGGVKAGSGVTIGVDGTLDATGSGGTITGVGAGTGLGGGGASGAVTLFLRPATSNTIGGVYPGENVTIDPDGRINVSDAALGVLTVSGNDPIFITGTSTNPAINIQPASTTQIGAVTLSSSITSTDDFTAANSLAVKTVADIANAALPLTGGTLTGSVTFTGGQSFPGTISGSVFSQLGQILIGDNSPPGYATLPLGANGQVLVANSGAPLGVEWQTNAASPTLQIVTTNGATTNVATTFRGGGAGETDRTVVLDGRTIKFFTDGTPDELILIDNMPGGSQQIRLGTNFSIFNGPGDAAPKIGNRIPATGTFTINGSTAIIFELDLTSKVVLDSTGFNVNTPFKASNISYPTADGTSGQALITDGAGNLSFSSSFLQKSGGTLTGDITFNTGQTFPGVVAQGALSGTSPIVVGGTIANPIISVSTATALALGVVRPDGTTITINGSGVISAAAGGSSLPLAGGTMTGDIVFAGTQTFPGTIANSLLTTTGDIIFASAASTPTRLGIGAAGTILAVNGGLPAYRTTLQLGLLTSAAAATTYAPLNSPAFTGPITVNGGGAAGSNAFTISGGNLVLTTSFTPSSSADTGSTGEISWDTDYLYICVSPNTWGRVAIDLTPF